MDVYWQSIYHNLDTLKCCLSGGVAKAHEGNGRVEFEDQSSSEYDFVVLVIPASTFRDVDFSDSKIERNRLAKMELIGYGGNYKIGVPIDMRWRNDIRLVITDDMMSFFSYDDTVMGKKSCLMYISLQRLRLEVWGWR